MDMTTVHRMLTGRADLPSLLLFWAIVIWAFRAYIGGCIRLWAWIGGRISSRHTFGRR